MNGCYINKALKLMKRVLLFSRVLKANPNFDLKDQIMRS